MYPAQFTCIRLKGHDIIGVAGSKVFLTVYKANDALIKSPQEKQFYVELPAGILIFQTTGYDRLMNPYHLQLLYAAIVWYGRTKLKQSNVKVSLTDPRRKNSNEFNR